MGRTLCVGCRCRLTGVWFRSDKKQNFCSKLCHDLHFAETEQDRIIIVEKWRAERDLPPKPSVDLEM